MGISETKKQIVIDNYFKNTCDVNTSIKEAFTKGFEVGLTKAVFPKDQYENRLKADMIAMLKDLQLEIEELDSNHKMPDVWSNQASKEIWNTALKLIEEIIEVRINNLKGMTKDGERPNE